MLLLHEAGADERHRRHALGVAAQAAQLGDEVGAQVPGRRSLAGLAEVGEGGGREVGLAAVAQVDGRLAHARLGGDAVDAHAGVALGGEQAQGGVDDRGVNGGRSRPAGPAGARGGGHGISVLNRLVFFAG